MILSFGKAYYFSGGVYFMNKSGFVGRCVKSGVSLAFFGWEGGIFLVVGE